MPEHRVRIRLLDDSIESLPIRPSALGTELLQRVYDHLQLIEQDYFSLRCVQSDGDEVWIDPGKTLKSQVQSLATDIFSFEVKFWPTQPGSVLIDEHTRYLFTLQIKRDLKNDVCHCPDETLISLASYFAQALFEDYEHELCDDRRYLFELLPDIVTSYNSAQIRDRHKLNKGMSSGECDIQILSIAAKLDSYGLRRHPTKGSHHFLTVNPIGVQVLDTNDKRIKTFDWCDLRKISFHGDCLNVKLKKNNIKHQKPTVRFKMASRDHAKAFWKLCVETHAFFFMPVCDKKCDLNGTRKRGKHGFIEKDLKNFDFGLQFWPVEIHRGPMGSVAVHHCFFLWSRKILLIKIL